MKPINLSVRHLQMCVAVARKGTLLRAGESLRLTPSAVSMGVKEAEQQLGCRLFARTGQGLRLNPKGRHLLPRMEELLRQVLELQERGRSTRDHLGGHLIVGASSTIGCYLLPPIIAAFRERHPAAQIDLIVHNSQDTLRELHKANIDLALSEGRRFDPRCEITKFCRDELVAFAHPDHPLFAQKRLTWRQLQTETWLLREPGSGTQEVFRDFCLNSGLKPERTINVGDTHAIKQMAQLKMGIACLSRLAIAKEIENGELRAFPLKPVPRDFYVVTRKNAFLGEVAERFIIEGRAACA